MHGHCADRAECISQVPAQTTEIEPVAKQHSNFSTFKSPCLSAPAPVLPEGPSSDKFFKVLWTKEIKKKHRRYEDGILRVASRRYTLFDSEGKMVSTKLLSQAPKLPESGDVVLLGRQELEICHMISATEYTSGACFLQHNTAFLDAAIAPGWQQTGPNPKRKCAGGASKRDSTGQTTTADSSESSASWTKAPIGTYILNSSRISAGNAEAQEHDVWVDAFLNRCLRPHQLEGLQFLYNCVSAPTASTQGCILADDMGLGKTLTSLSLLWVLLRRGPRGSPLVRKAIVVTPASLVRNWVREISKWLGHTRLLPEVVLGEHKEAEDQFRTFPVSYKPLLITSYDIFRRHAALLADYQCDLLICDEGHRLKNESTQIVKALLKLRCPRRILLTGTPVQNDLYELHTLMEFVAPGVLGSRDSFRILFAECIARSREPTASTQERELGLARQEELTRRTRPFLLRRTAAVIQKQLPPRTELLIFTHASSLQARLYECVLKSKAVGQLLARPNGGGFADALTCITRIRKILAYPSVLAKEESGEDAKYCAELAECLPPDMVSGPVDPKLSGKLHALQCLLRAVRERTTDRVVVVSNSTQVLDVIEKLLLQETWPSLRLDGATPVARRMDLVERFNNPRSDIFVLLLSCKAGGVGLNLIGANRLVLFDPDWNPANDAQAMARVWRDGQTKPVLIYRFFTAGTLEEKILQRQGSKGALARLALDALPAAEGCKWGQSDLRRLFGFAPDARCETFAAEAEGWTLPPEFEAIDPVLCRAMELGPAVSFVSVADHTQSATPIADEPGSPTTAAAESSAIGSPASGSTVPAPPWEDFGDVDALELAGDGP